MAEVRWTDAIGDVQMRCLIRNGVGMTRQKYLAMTLAGVVSHLFGIGHTHATELCRRAGLDPYKAPTRDGKCHELPKAQP